MNEKCPECQTILADDDWFASRLAANDTCADGLFYCIDCLAENKCPCKGFTGGHPVLISLDQEEAALEKAEAQLREAIAVLNKDKS